MEKKIDSKETETYPSSEPFRSAFLYNLLMANELATRLLYFFRREIYEDELIDSSDDGEPKSLLHALCWSCAMIAEIMGVDFIELVNGDLKEKVLKFRENSQSLSEFAKEQKGEGNATIQ